MLFDEQIYGGRGQPEYLLSKGLFLPKALLKKSEQPGTYGEHSYCNKKKLCIFTLHFPKKPSQNEIRHSRKSRAYFLASWERFLIVFFFARQIQSFAAGRRLFPFDIRRAGGKERKILPALRVPGKRGLCQQGNMILNLCQL